MMAAQVSIVQISVKYQQIICFQNQEFYKNICKDLKIYIFLIFKDIPLIISPMKGKNCGSQQNLVSDSCYLHIRC